MNIFIIIYITNLFDRIENTLVIKLIGSVAIEHSEFCLTFHHITCSNSPSEVGYYSEWLFYRLCLESWLEWREILLNIGRKPLEMWDN